jgi:hypothetical protein
MNLFSKPNNPLWAVSVVLNGTTHDLKSTRTAPSWLLVLAVAAVPPTVLGLWVHLAAELGSPGRPVVGFAAPAGAKLSMQKRLKVKQRLTPHLTRLHT